MRALKYYFLCLAFLATIGANGQLFTEQYSIVNDAVSRYLSEVTYTSIEEPSRVIDYTVYTGERLDLPLPVVINVPSAYRNFVKKGLISFSYSFDKDFSESVTHTITLNKTQQQILIYDVQPGMPCYYRFFLRGNLVHWGVFETEGQLRMIYVPSMGNVRDLGGWPVADGRSIKFGKLIRGIEMNGMHPADEEDIHHLLDIGVAAELDLRADYEDAHGISAFNFKSESEVETGEVPTYLYMNDSGQLLKQMTQYSYLQRWRKEFQFIVQNLRLGRTVYYHCRWGADRTGYLSLLLEGLLGVGYDGLVKDYELTSFNEGLRKEKESIDPIISFIMTHRGTSLQQQFNTFWRQRVGVSQDDIDYFIEEMLEGEKIPDEDPVVTGIDDRQSPDNDVVKGYFSMDGKPIDRQHRGIILERYRDGKVRKIIR